MILKFTNHLSAWLVAMLLLNLAACQKSASSNDPVSTDKSQPAAVSNVRVENFNGEPILFIRYPTPQPAICIGRIQYSRR
ncbi:hypothetical protein KRR40_33015 [Niabella defluvii]|nr:hypothetical protein KRR40_33015 [Niabella sp. I65]